MDNAPRSSRHDLRRWVASNYAGKIDGLDANETVAAVPPRVHV